MNDDDFRKAIEDARRDERGRTERDIADELEERARILRRCRDDAAKTDPAKALLNAKRIEYEEMAARILASDYPKADPKPAAPRTEPAADERGCRCGYCGKWVGNPVFTCCDDCWDLHPLDVPAGAPRSTGEPAGEPTPEEAIINALVQHLTVPPGATLTDVGNVYEVARSIVDKAVGRLLAAQRKAGRTGGEP